MGKGTLLGLVALVVLLGFAWLAKQRETLRGGPALGEYPLCPTLDLERVRALRVDHVERGFQLGFERDAAGRWFMTDPLAYPAQGALIRMLLQSLASAHAVPAPEVARAAVGLDPPAVVVECVQLASDGKDETVRIEIGALDVDPSLVYARVPGHPAAAAAGGADVFRTTRSLATTLERNPDDYRERRATPLLATDVVALRRSGSVQLKANEPLTDLGFDALLTPDGWKLAAPSVSLDPNGMGLLVRGACELSAERFADDSPTDLALFGLDAPAFTLELEAPESPPVTLEFGHPHTDAPLPLAEYTWFCQRRGFAHVWELRTRDVELLASPKDLFFDQLVVRTVRADVVRLELEGGGAKRVLERDKKGWTVREGRGDDAEAVAQALESAPRHPGNPAAIEEALGLLERVQLAEHLLGETFEPSAPPVGFTLALKNGALQGGRLGRATRDPKSSAEGLQFLRLGDQVVALIDASVAELCARPLDAFRSRKVHQIQESTVRVIELEHAKKTYAYVNTGDNVWNPRGQSIQAPAAFLQSLDGLLNLGAKRWLDAVPEHQVVLDVRILPSTQGEPQSFAFARLADGTTLCLTSDGLAAEVDGAVVDRLLALF